MIALICLGHQEVLRTFAVDREAAVRVDLPNGTQLSPVTLGWTDGTYAVCAVEPFEVPAGRIIVGPASYTFGDGVVHEVYETQDIPPEPIPETVTARQFKMQLVIDHLRAEVEAWVASQGELVQVAYDNSREFRRDEPMMQAGFAALGYTQERIDTFFINASKL